MTTDETHTTLSQLKDAVLYFSVGLGTFNMACSEKPFMKSRLYLSTASVSEFRKCGIEVSLCHFL